MNQGHADAEWTSDQTTRKSTSDYFTFVEGNLVTWKNNKQKVVARSSAEAEFRGVAHGVLLWITVLSKIWGLNIQNV